MATHRNCANCLYPYATHWRDGPQEDEQIDNKQRIEVLATWLITYFYVENKCSLQLLKEVTRIEFSTKGN